MKNLKLSDWANIAEIVASVAIIISLGYVGLEISQNTKTIQDEAHRRTLEMMNTGQNILATDKEFHAIYVAGLDSPSELSDEEWSRFVQFTLPRLGAWEYLYLAKLQGSVSKGAWAAFDPFFRDLVCKPGLKRFIDEYESAFAPEFVNYVNDDPLKACARAQ